MFDVLRNLIADCFAYLLPGGLFTSPPEIKFRPATAYCPQCNSSLSVLKTQTKTVYSMLIGRFIAHHTLLHCNKCSNSDVYHSDDLLRIVAPYSKYAYDVIVYIGGAMFEQHRSITEIHKELKKRAIDISASEISYLAKKFVIYLSVAHRNMKDNIKDYFIRQGGYILHLDGTTQGDSPHLISTIDELSKFVLGNIKVISEKSGLIQPLLHDLKQNYGDPIAITTDMGKAMLLAVNEVFPKVENFICHFHFLRDIGNDLLKGHYTLLRNALKKYGMTTVLQYRKRELKKKQSADDYQNIIQQITNTSNSSVTLDAPTANAICYMVIIWILEGKKQGNGYGFPFDRVLLCFYTRIMSAYNNLKRFVKNSDTPQQQKATKNIRKLIQALEPMATDSQLATEVKVLEQNISIFDQLRQALRIALPQTKNGLNDQGADIEIKTIEKDVSKFTQEVKNRQDYLQNKDLHKMVEQIEKYNQKLFADPITVKTDKGTIQIQPQRTNNIMEQFFRDFRRSHRRNSGNDAINKKLKAILADTLLIKNLDNKEYMKILLQGKSNLEHLFADIETKLVRQEFEKLNQENENIPTKMKTTIKQDDFWKILNLP